MKDYADGKILVEDQGPVTYVTINRLEVRNALDNDAARGLGRAMRDFDADDGQLVAVLSGTGGAFCAGADLKQVAGSAEYVAWAGDEEGPTNPTLSKPVIGAVAGHAVAGGLGVALWCDIRVVDDSTVFGVFCRRWGVPMSDGTTVRLPRLIGQARALDMLIT
ncbi:MAG: enoyl-CoA hydratase, partial [Rhodospirillaceae bacterium]|nr:enoyl-CoA hydratase [Rhodospirillaceae bacterium]